MRQFLKPSLIQDNIARQSVLLSRDKLVKTLILFGELVSVYIGITCHKKDIDSDTSAGCYLLWRKHREAESRHNKDDVVDGTSAGVLHRRHPRLLDSMLCKLFTLFIN